MTQSILSSVSKLAHNRSDLNELNKTIQKDLEKVERELQSISSSPNPLISEINAYLFQKTGKRIRPALVILCSKLLGYEGEAHILMSALVEIIHTASLIHDDIIDNANLRRGKETVHARWGPYITVLLGDYLYIKSINLSLQFENDRINRLLSDVSTQMIEGELVEYSLSRNLNLNESEYLDIVQRKTASLFAASCQIAAILSKAPAEEEEWLGSYGLNLGMSFQIIDDLLDFKGNEKMLGKPVLSDLSEGRITLPLIYTLRTDGGSNQERIRELFERKILDQDSKEEILQIVKNNGALDYTYQKASEFHLRSQEIIGHFPPSPPRETLHLLAEFILNREK
jgi:octaprenyl-diphosphate synthase